MPIATPPASGIVTTSNCCGSEPSAGSNVIVIFPAPGTLKFVDLYWSPWA